MLINPINKLLLTIWASSKCGKFSNEVNPILFKEKWIKDLYFSKVVLCSSVNLSISNKLSNINSWIYIFKLIFRFFIIYWILFTSSFLWDPNFSCNDSSNGNDI